MPSIYGVDQGGAKHVAAAAGVATEVLARWAADVDAKGRFPVEALAALRDAGLLGLCAPGQLGGGGQGARTFAAVVEELARACASTAMVYVMHISASQAIAASATLRDRDAVLREVAAGRHLTTLALSEVGSRSQFWTPVSELTVTAPGRYVTTAHKSWVTAARHAQSYVASARAPGGMSGTESVLYLARPRAGEVGAAGVFDGLGLRGNDAGPVEIDRHQLGDGDLVCATGQGSKLTIDVVLPWFCVGSAAMANGLCRAAVDVITRHLGEAELETTGARLRDLPNLRARLAEMSVRTEQARALLGHTLAEMAAPSEATPLYVLQARLASLQAAVEVTDLAMKTGGGTAFSKRLPIERIFRDARAGWVMSPTADHLADFVGRLLTGLPLL
jgi:alkylation response protein AidB-like acyl-CoA dehydrogenase